MKTLDIIDIYSITDDFNLTIGLFKKEEPNKIIFNLPFDWWGLMKWKWKKWNLRIFYNGETFWLNPDILNKTGIKEDELDIWGLRPIGKKNINIDWNKVKNIKGKLVKLIYEPIFGLEFSNKEIDKIKKEFISKGYNVLTTSKLSSVFDWGQETVYNIIEHLLGKKIKNLQFTDLNQSRYESVIYWTDDTFENKYLGDINDQIQMLIENTPNNISKEIIKTVNDDLDDISLTINKFTTNQANPILKEKILINKIIKTFEHFKSFENFSK